jgi:patatin-related protein
MAAASPQAEYTQEVRFAIVMYGGVSLAIYINGIAQELLRLVRATAEAGTAPDGSRMCLTAARNGSAKNQLSGTELVYRKLSHLLADKHLLAECRNLAAQVENTPAPNALTDRLDQIVADNARPINVRFVVDILSGTSAGGINAIYLAKALANEQGIDQLKQLWINEGDIGVLLNDKRSVAGINLENQQPPQSLLNSRRMYLKLLKSLNDMETTNKSRKGFNSCYVDEIDLFITTTDIAGVPVPIRLSDTVVYERRHRNVFHFKYASEEAAGDERNDFLGANDPFLAFAARCTSSFPFAFEPMKLSDIDEVLDTFTDYRDADKEAMKKEWQRFFKEKASANSAQRVKFSDRSFGDGGYLDNKPFTYATETLARRYAALPVDRKLIYIEPSPEHPEDTPLNSPRPDALKNVKAALLDLPAYETIREDLQRLMQRNVLINRINRITTAVDHDLDRANSRRPKIDPGEWERLDLAGMVDKFGVYYLPYRRLRIAAVTDALAELIGRILRIEDESAQSIAIRVLIRAWREQKYPDYHREQPTPAANLAFCPHLPRTRPQVATTPVPPPPKTQDELEEESEADYTANQLLLHYDFAYWLRRLNFIRRKVDLLYKLQDLPADRDDGYGIDESQLSSEEEATLKRFTLLRYHAFDYSKLTAAEKRSIHDLLIFIRSQLKVIYRDLRLQGRKLQSSQNTIAEKIKQIPLTVERLRYLLNLPEQSDLEPDFSKLDEEKCMDRAREILADPEFYKSFQAAARTLKKEMTEKVVDPTWTRCYALFKPTEDLPAGSREFPRPDPLRPYANGVREFLWRYFSQFDDFDQISFPIMYGLEEGESDVVEVIRISPEDATTLINERREKKESADGVGRRKLAGTALHHFGAFLDRTWRQNDIMWGRLDGAERLITALLPNLVDEDVRNELIRQAHTAILFEEIPPENRKQLGALMADALMRASSGEPLRDAIERVLNDLDSGSSVRKRLEMVMCNSLEDTELLNFITSGYEVNRKTDAKMMLQAMSRSTQVIGKVFEDIANQNSLDSKGLAWIARLGQIFWGLVEVAVPGSILNLLIMHWLHVLYVFEVVLIVLCFLFAAPELQTFALKIFALTAVIHLVVLILRDKMRGKNRWLWVPVIAGAGLVVFLTVVGLADLLGFGLSQKIVGWFQPVKAAGLAVQAKLKPVGDVLRRIF